jgi:RNA polymerase-binding transcription factor DksA
MPTRPAPKATPAKAPAKKTTVTKKAVAKKAAPPPAKKAAPAKKAPAPAAKKVARPKKAAAPPTKKATPAKAPAKATAKPAPKSPAVRPPVKKAAPPAPPKKAAPKRAPKKALDEWLVRQQGLLLEERARLSHQAESLKAEADALAEDMEPGDVQFDEESGEGATMTVERERDLALSAQARAEIDEIDRALVKIDLGTYGTCERCGHAIPKERLKFIPQAALCVSCKTGSPLRR